MAIAKFNKKGSCADVSGFSVGHAENDEYHTGLTVILATKGAIGGISIGGFATGLRGADGLWPNHMVQDIHGILFTGGSSFGLNATKGVQSYLEQKGYGLKAGPICIPIVPTAVIFDLAFTKAKARPDAELAFKACRNAHNGTMKRGNVGVGCGATVGKFFGPLQATKGGLGGASLSMGELKAGCLTVVNAFGDIIDKKGRIIAGAREKEDSLKLINTSAQYLKGATRKAFSAPSNTTLSCITTNAKLDKTDACRLAQMAQHGMIRTINPTHTTFDGDLIIVLTSNQVEADLNGLGVLFAGLVQMSILDGVLAAQTLNGLPSANELTPL